MRRCFKDSEEVLMDQGVKGAFQDLWVSQSSNGFLRPEVMSKDPHGPCLRTQRLVTGSASRRRRAQGPRQESV